VADYCDSIDFAQGISWCLNEARLPALSAAARTTALATYAEAVAAQRYLAIYQQALTNL
jgi:hypothetical protein